MSGDVTALAKVLAEHASPGELLAVFEEAWLPCGCGERIDIPVRDGKVSHQEIRDLSAAHVAAALLASPALQPLLAAAEQRGRVAALREAADDQEWWLTGAMDGDFLIVDCGHFGHEEGRVGLSDVRPTDVTRWAAEHLRERAAREEAQ